MDETVQILALIGIGVAATQLCRWLPSLVFADEESVPGWVHYLGKALPPALWGMLVVYAVRATDVMGPSHGIPELIAGGLVVALQAKWGNMAVSMICGTAAYMMLIRIV